MSGTLTTARGARASREMKPASCFRDLASFSNRQKRLPELLRLRLGRLRSALGASLLWRVGRRTRLARRRMARSSLTRSSATVPGVLRHSAARGAFVRQRGFNTASIFCFKPIFEELFLRRFLVVGLCFALGSGHAAELKLAGDLSRLPALVSRTSLSRSMDAASRFSPASR